MDPNALVREIVAAFRRLEKEVLQLEDDQRPDGGGPWTKEVLTTLCKLGRKLGYTAWATGSHPNRVPDEYRDGDEWLYDASWRHSDTYDRIIFVPMVAESEWGDLKKIEEDFQKLLLARSTIRVMVYYAKDKDSDWNRRYKNRLREHVGAFNGTRGDTYLLIAYLDDKERGERGFKLKFSAIIDQGSGNLPISQTL